MDIEEKLLLCFQNIFQVLEFTNGDRGEAVFQKIFKVFDFPNWYRGEAVVFFQL